MSKRSGIHLRLVLTAVLLVSAVAFSPAFAPAQEAKLVSVSIVHSNDTHGNFRKTWDGGSSMPATIAAVKREFSGAAGRATLLLDGGDIASYKVPSFDDVTADMLAMDAAGYDAMALGNHDVDFGVEKFAELSRRVKFPVLSASLVKKSDGSYIFKPYVVRQAGPLKIGIIGLTSNAVLKSLKPEEAAGITFMDTAEAFLKVLPEVKKSCDAIILLSHLGIEDDRAMARAFPEIKLIVGAHSHTLVDRPEYVGKTCIVQTGRFAENLGRLDVKFSGSEVQSVDASIIRLKK